jgi:ABC-type glycerol-3-phosphate transport system permease component
LWSDRACPEKIAMIPMLVLYIVFNRQFIRGVMGGALK